MVKAGQSSSDLNRQGSHGLAQAVAMNNKNDPPGSPRVILPGDAVRELNTPHRSTSMNSQMSHLTLTRSLPEQKFLDLMRSMDVLNDEVGSGLESINSMLRKEEERGGQDQQYIKKVTKNLRLMSQTISELCEEEAVLSEQLELIGQCQESKPLAGTLMGLSQLHRLLFNLRDECLGKQTKMAIRAVEGMAKRQTMSSELSYGYEKSITRWKAFWSVRPKKPEPGVLERDKVAVQLETCQYLIKIKDAKYMQEIDFLREIIGLAQAEQVYFEKGMEIILDRRAGMDLVRKNIAVWTQAHHMERKDLVRLQTEMKSRKKSERNTKGMSTPSVTSIPGNLNANFTRFENTKSGWIYKQVKQLKTWQKRWILIEKGVYYIKSSPDGSTLFAINLVTCTVREDPPSDAIQYGFRVITPQKIFQFYVESKEELNSWLSAIRQNINDVLNKDYDSKSLAPTEKAFVYEGIPRSELEQRFLDLVKEQMVNPSEGAVERYSLIKSLLERADERSSADQAHIKKVAKTIKIMGDTLEEMIDEERSLSEQLQLIGNCQESKPLADTLSGLSNLHKDLVDLRSSCFSTQTKMALHAVEGMMKHSGESSELSRGYEKNMSRWRGGFLSLKRIRPDFGSSNSDRDRLNVQLETCEYLLKIKDAAFKKEIDFLTELVELYASTLDYFTKGLAIVTSVKDEMEVVTSSIELWNQAHLEERQDLERLQSDLRYKLRPERDRRRLSNGSRSSSRASHLSGSTVRNLCFKAGWIYKLGKQLRTWQKRWAILDNGMFYLKNSPDGTTTVPVSLLTCTVKEDHYDSSKYCFRLVSMTKSWIFSVDSEDELKSWLSLIRQSINDLLINDAERYSKTPESQPAENDFKKYTANLCQIPGNEVCADCFSHGPDWVSLNLGVLICITCSGIHREMGVQVSKVRSLALDTLTCNEIMIVNAIGNNVSNSIYLGKLTVAAIDRDSDIATRKNFIMMKYKEKSFVVVKHPTDLLQQQAQIKQVIKMDDIATLVQMRAEGVDLTSPLSEMDEIGMTPLHFAAQCGAVVCLTYILVANITPPNTVTGETQSTALHIAAKLLQVDCIQALLRYGAKISRVDREGNTARMVIPLESTSTSDLDSRLSETRSLDDVNVLERLDSQEDVNAKPVEPTAQEELVLKCMRLLTPHVDPRAKVCTCPFDDSMECNCRVHGCGPHMCMNADAMSLSRARPAPSPGAFDGNGLDATGTINLGKLNANDFFLAYGSQSNVDLKEKAKNTVPARAIAGTARAVRVNSQHFSPLQNSMSGSSDSVNIDSSLDGRRTGWLLEGAVSMESSATTHAGSPLAMPSGTATVEQGPP
eukprot:Ihof_evm1s266 gene=Ihof_evmTU1s266